jgi:hypothetical protein
MTLFPYTTLFRSVVLGTYRIEYARALINEIQERSRSEPWDEEGERKTDTQIQD